MLGVPLDRKSWMFGNNESVVKASTIPQSNLMKRHNALAYHRVCEAIAAGVIEFLHIPGVQNPADVLTKFLPYTTMWPLIEPILFWKGETSVKPMPTSTTIHVLSGNRVDDTLTEGSNTNMPDASHAPDPPWWTVPGIERALIYSMYIDDTDSTDY